MTDAYQNVSCYYVAFSIHGTDTFLIATLTSALLQRSFTEPIVVKGRIFSRVQSRLAASRNSGNVKLHTDLLQTKEGQPLRDPGRVMKAFRTLESEGWVINPYSLAAFRQKHWPGLCASA